MAKNPDPPQGSWTQGSYSPAYHVGGNVSGNSTVQQGNRNKSIRKNTRNNFSFRGVGGLVLGVVLLGGGGAATYAVIKPEAARVADAVGTWELKAAPGNVADMPSTLVVGADGSFQLTMKAQFRFPDMGGGTPGLPDMTIDCRGSMRPDSDHLALSTTAGPCGSMTAKVDGQRIDVTLTGNGGPQTISLRKTA